MTDQKQRGIAKFEPLCWFGIWFLLITSVYWLGLIAFPKRDSSVFMLGRILFDSDLEWFLKTLNYARTRLLLPGDSFAFRPVHMFILGLEDLFFRYDLVVQGILSSALFSFTATSLFLVARKLSGRGVFAFGITAFWAFQLAGSEILMWQHISPYVLFPGLLCAALLLMSDRNAGRSALVMATVLVFMAGLTHEIGGPIAMAVAFGLYLTGAEDKRRYVLPLFVGGAVALGISAFDYFLIHRIASFTGSADSVSSASLSSLLSSILPFTGAIGVAAFIPGSVHVFHLDNWFIGWNFVNIAAPVTILGAILVAVILAFNIVQTWRSFRKNSELERNAVSLFALALFALSYAVSLYRIFMRDAGYMMSAPYYFSLLSLSLAIMLVLIVTRLQRRSLTVAVSIALLILGGWHVVMLQGELRATRGEKVRAYQILNQSRETILKDSSVCFGGTDPSTVPSNYKMWNPLYQDLACTGRRGATPLYLSYLSGSPALTAIQQAEEQTAFREMKLQAFPSADSPMSLSAVIPFGHAFEVTLDKVKSPAFILASQKGQLGFVLDYDLVTSVINDQTAMLYSSLLWDPGKTTTTYRVTFTRDRELIFFANGIYLGMLPDVGLQPGAPCRLEIFSGAKNPVRVTQAKVSTQPVMSDLRFVPVQVF